MEVQLRVAHEIRAQLGTVHGDHARANAYSRLRYPQMVLPWVVERILDTAPRDADVDSWRY